MTLEEAVRPAGPRGHRSTRLLSDDRLARRAARGDRRAMEEVCARYRQDLYRFCLTMLGDPQDAQDAVQNTFVKVIRALPGERRRIQLRPWLYRIARNESVELVRGRREVSGAEVEAVSPMQLADTVEARERLRALIEDLGALVERQRASLMMRELGGLGIDEIAAALETSEGAVRQSIYEARLGLRQMECGREMSCEEVTRRLSEADGRVARRRDLRAHLRGCSDCRAFRDGIARRRSDLAAISPLPAVASAALIQGLAGGGASAAAGSLVAKSAATIAVVAVVGVSAADRSGVVDVPLPGDGGVERQAVPADREPPQKVPEGPREPIEGDAAAAAVGGQAGAGAEHENARGIRHGSRGTVKAAGAPAGVAPGGAQPQDRGASAEAPQGHARGSTGSRGRPAGMPPAPRRGHETAATHRSPSAPSAGRAGPGTDAAGPASSRPESSSQPPDPPAQAGKPESSPPPQAAAPEVQSVEKAAGKAAATVPEAP